MKYFPNYNEGCKIFEDDNHARSRYFQVTSKMVFETQLLQDISSNVWVSGATFQSRAKVYNLNFEAKDSGFYG